MKKNVHEITIKVVDKLGNYKEVSKKFVYSLEDKVCKLNCDIDGDGDKDAFKDVFYSIK